MNVIIAELLRISQRNLQASQRLITRREVFAIQLAQDAADFLVWVVLTSEEIQTTPHLGLGRLVEMIPEVNPIKRKLREIVSLISSLSSHPSTNGQSLSRPAAPLLLSCLEKIEACLTEAAVHFGVDLTPGADSPAQSTEPIR